MWATLSSGCRVQLVERHFGAAFAGVPRFYRYRIVVFQISPFPCSYLWMRLTVARKASSFVSVSCFHGRVHYMQLHPWANATSYGFRGIYTVMAETRFKHIQSSWRALLFRNRFSSIQESPSHACIRSPTTQSLYIEQSFRSLAVFMKTLRRVGPFSHQIVGCWFLIPS